MTLDLYLDDCSDGRLQRRVLEADGHVVTSPADVGLRGADDAQHFAYARSRNLVLLTENPRDFRRLHARDPHHAGVLLVYQDNDVSRDMTEHEIARAIRNLLAAGMPMAGHVHVLNHWRY